MVWCKGHSDEIESRISFKPIMQGPFSWIGKYNMLKPNTGESFVSKMKSYVTWRKPIFKMVQIFVHPPLHCIKLSTSHLNKTFSHLKSPSAHSTNVLHVINFHWNGRFHFLQWAPVPTLFGLNPLLLEKFVLLCMYFMDDDPWEY